jgi:hypothetical protein
MTKPVPLRTALGVKSDGVVVYRAGSLMQDRMFRGYAPEAWRGHTRERPVGRDTGAIDNLASSLGRVLRREEVEHPALIVCPKETPSVAFGSIFA